MKNLISLSAVTVVAALAFAPSCGSPAVDCTDAPHFADVSGFAKCTSCHSSTLSGGDRFGAPGDINYDTFAGASHEPDEALSEVNEGSMPPAGSPELTADEKATLDKWVQCGSPE